MAVTPERTAKPLHNFDAFRCLKWGSNGYLRCVKLGPGDAGGGGGSIDHRSLGLIAPRRVVSASERRLGSRLLLKPRETMKDHAGGGGGEEEGIAVMREKLMVDLKKATDKLKERFFGWKVAAEKSDDDADRKDDVATSASAAATPADSRPWNLRKRKAAVSAKSSRIEERKVNCSPATTRPPRRVPQKKERVKFAVALSRKEIESDFAEILGKRPPSRPKKRPRPIQNQLDSLFPGLLLGEITADTYKVEGPKKGKTR